MVLPLISTYSLRNGTARTVANYTRASNELNQHLQKCPAPHTRKRKRGTPIGAATGDVARQAEEQHHNVRRLDVVHHNRTRKLRARLAQYRTQVVNLIRGGAIQHHSLIHPELHVESNRDEHFGITTTKISPVEQTADVDGFLLSSADMVVSAVNNDMLNEPSIRIHFTLMVFINDPQHPDDPPREWYLPIKEMRLEQYDADRLRHAFSSFCDMWRTRVDDVRPDKEKSGMVLSHVGRLDVKTLRYATDAHSIVHPTGILNVVAAPAGGSFIELPKGVHGVVNIQNTDNECLKWSIERSLLYFDWVRDASTKRWTQKVEETPASTEWVKKEINNANLGRTWINREKKGKFQADWASLFGGSSLRPDPFPVIPQKGTLELIQRKLDITLHVWELVDGAYTKLFTPSDSSLEKTDRPTCNLLYISEEVKGVGSHGHFMMISNLSTMLTNHPSKAKKSHGHGEKVCAWCNARFRTQELFSLHQNQRLCYIKHLDAAHLPEVRVPQAGTRQAYLYFKSYGNMQFTPYILVADFECANVKSSTTRHTAQTSATFSISRYCSFDNTMNKTTVHIPLNDDDRKKVPKAFLDALRQHRREIYDHRLKHHLPETKDIIWQDGDKERHEQAKTCMYCRLEFRDDSAHIGALLQPPPKKAVDKNASNLGQETDAAGAFGEELDHCGDEPESACDPATRWCKVADHDHATGLYRGAACSHCNLQVQDGVYLDKSSGQYKISRAKFYLPVIFHNFKNYDVHLVLQALSEEVPSDEVIIKKNGKQLKLDNVISAIPQQGDKFMSVRWKSEGITFMDSMSFIKSSLADAVDGMIGIKPKDKHNTPEEEKQRGAENDVKLVTMARQVLHGTGCEATTVFDYLRSQLPDLATHFNVKLTEQHVQSCLRKGVWWYEWFENIGQLDNPNLPSAKDGANKLANSDQISETDMAYADEVFKLWNMKSTRDFLYFYSWLDTVLLTCVFNARRIANFANTGLDCCRYVSLPSMGLDNYLKSGNSSTLVHNSRTYTVPFHVSLIDNVDHFNFALALKRGGISTVKERFAETIEGKQSIVYVDANSLYPTAMHEPLPTGNVSWANNFTADNIVDQLTAWDEDGNHGYAGRVDIHIKPEYHDYYKDYPLFAENRNINILELSHEQLRQLAEQGRNPMQPKTRDNPQDSLDQIPEIRSVTPHEAESYPILLKCRDYNAFIRERADVRPILSPYGCDGVWEFITRSAHEVGYIEFRDSILKQADMRFDFLKSHKAHVDVNSQRLMLTLNDKYGYFVHFKMLKWALLHRPGSIVVTRVHQVVQFDQSPHMKDFVGGYMKLRAEVKNDNPVLAEMIKLIINSLYGKTCQDDRKFRDMKFVHDPTEMAYMVGDSRFVSERALGEYRIVQLSKKHVTIQKPVLIGACIMELSKLVMFKAWYEHFKPSFPGVAYDGERRLRLLMTDTDSLCFLVKASDCSAQQGDLAKVDWHWQQEMKDNGHSHIMDFSSYPKGHPFKDDSRKGVKGAFKDEGEGHTIKAFVGFGSKFYCLLFDNMVQSLKAKGIVLNQSLMMETDDFTRCMADESFTTDDWDEDTRRKLSDADGNLFAFGNRRNGAILKVQHYLLALRKRTYKVPAIKQTRIGTDGQQNIQVIEGVKRTINVADMKNYALAPSDCTQNSVETVPYGYVRPRCGESAVCAQSGWPVNTAGLETMSDI